MRSTARWLLLAGIGFGLALTTSGRHALAGTRDCKVLRESPRKEPLSQFLLDISAARGIQVMNLSGENPVVSHAGGSDVELMTALSGQVNLLARYSAAKECLGGYKVETIWVLPQGANTNPQPVPARARTPVPLPTPTPAEAAAAKAAMDMYMKGHGHAGAASAAASAASGSQ